MPPDRGGLCVSCALCALQASGDRSLPMAGETTLSVTHAPKSLLFGDFAELRNVQNPTSRSILSILRHRSPTGRKRPRTGTCHRHMAGRASRWDPGCHPKPRSSESLSCPLRLRGSTLLMFAEGRRGDILCVVMVVWKRAANSGNSTHVVVEQSTPTQLAKNAAVEG